jgi:hypothetical protein
MWWKYVKQADDDHTAIYFYAYTDMEKIDGELWHDKDTGETTITRYSYMDNPKYSRAAEKFYQVIKAGYPDKKTVAIG